jgi:hypothetical protein
MALKVIGYYTERNDVDEEENARRFPLNLAGMHGALTVLDKKFPETNFQCGTCNRLINGVFVGFNVYDGGQEASLVFVSERANAGHLKQLIEDELGLPRPDQAFYLS